VLAAAERQANIDEAVPSSYQPDAPGASPAGPAEARDERVALPRVKPLPKKGRKKPKPKPKPRPAAESGPRAGWWKSRGRGPRQRSEGGRKKQAEPRGPRAADNGQSANGHPRKPAAAEDGLDAYHSGATLTARKLRWAWYGLLPEELPSLLFGPALIGKSSLLTAIAAAWTGGPPLPGEKRRKPRHVYWFYGEELLEETLIPRLKAAGAKMRYMHFLQRPRSGADLAWEFPSSKQKLALFLSRTPGALVVIDPAWAFLDDGLDDETGRAAAAAFGCFTDLGRKYQTTTIIVRHPSKPRAGDATDKISGHKKWFNIPRAVLLVGSKGGEEGAREVTQLKPSLTPEQPSWKYRLCPHKDTVRVEWLGATDADPGALLEQAITPAEKDALDEAREFLEGVLGDGWHLRTWVVKQADAAKVSWASIKRVLKSGFFKTERKGQGGGHCSFWALATCKDACPETKPKE
jgi:hypothetical protein